ncbi:MAG TPA: hypothetical protein VHA33_07470 [Candidatus Angelobacter sp.]|nr:hypothetical protein [Candidatus Angelobacter sp.]
MNLRRVRLSAAGCVLLVSLWATLAGPATALAQSNSPASSSTRATPVSPDPLGDLNQLFLDTYTARRVAVIQATSPFIVASGSIFVLHRNGQKDTIHVIPDIYHALKDISHVPFTIHLLLSSTTKDDGALTDTQAGQLSVLLGKIGAAHKALATGGFTPEELTRQDQILNASEAIVSAILQPKRVDRPSLIAFERKMGPLMMLNSNAAACYQIQRIHPQMMQWKNMMTSSEWDRLMVVIHSGHQPRYQNVVTQYFHWLFGDQGPSWSYPGESFRVTYAESLGPKEDASDELATVLIDADASAAFFQDPWRMSEDILSKGAAECIGKLPQSDRIKNDRMSPNTSVFSPSRYLSARSSVIIGETFDSSVTW